MTVLLDVSAVIFPVFLISLLGYLVANLRKLDLKTLADYIIYVASPSLALTQLSMSKIDALKAAKVSLASAMVILGCLAAAYLFFKLTRISAPAALYLPVIAMNSGFIGFPLVLFAFGAPALKFALIFNAVNALFIFTVGIALVTQGRKRWQFLKVPFLYAALAGLLLSLNNLRLPQFIFSPLYILGASAIPVALFMLGARLARLKITSWKLPFLASLIRLGAGLGLGLLAVFLLKLTGPAAKAVILLASLSSAITSVALAEEYDSSPDLVASTVALSLLLSVFVIAGVLKWLV